MGVDFVHQFLTNENLNLIISKKKTVTNVNYFFYKLKNNRLTPKKLIYN